MIKVSGFQVAPAEDTGCPARASSCRATALSSASADERSGEVPVAAVRWLSPAATADDLAALVADSLASYKHLRHVVVVDHIPRAAVGEVLRRVLRQEWEPKLAAAHEAV